MATQAFANPSYGPGGLALLREGTSAEEVVARLTEADEGRDDRQLGVVDREGRGATFTGSACFDWAGGRTGPGTRPRGTSSSRARRWTRSPRPSRARKAALGERLVACLAAAQAAGGDRRGQQSASLLVVRESGGYAGLSDTLVDLRVDDHPEPIAELERLLGLHTLLFGETPEEEWLAVDDDLAGEIRERLDRLGYGDPDLAKAFDAWAGTENLEERVRGLDRIDPVVLAELRKR